MLGIGGEAGGLVGFFLKILQGSDCFYGANAPALTTPPRTLLRVAQERHRGHFTRSVETIGKKLGCTQQSPVRRERTNTTGKNLFRPNPICATA